MKEYFENAASNWQKYRQRRSYYWNSITDYVGYYIHPDNTVLEIGCGTGELIASVNGSHKVGIDFCESLIEQARNAHPDGVDFYVMEAENITLDEKFDVVVLSNLVGFLDDIEKVLREIRKVCHERTRVIVTSYNRL